MNNERFERNLYIRIKHRLIERALRSRSIQDGNGNMQITHAGRLQSTTRQTPDKGRRSSH